MDKEQPHRDVEGERPRPEGYNYWTRESITPERLQSKAENTSDYFSALVRDIDDWFALPREHEVCYHEGGANFRYFHLAKAQAFLRLAEQEFDSAFIGTGILEGFGIK